MNLEEELRRVSDSLLSDVLKILGLPQTSGWRHLCELLLGNAFQRLADIGLTFDRMIVENGLRRAAEWSLSNWCRDITVRGRENVPEEGPLLVISNHPGVYDALVIASQVPRPDLHLIASNLPFFQGLRNFSQRICFIPQNINDAAGRMAGMLSALRYLKDGGSLLLMGSGSIDPDPAVYPGALHQLQRWTEAVNLFLRFVPQTHVLLSAVSHIVSPKWARHPLTWLRREGMERRRLAELGQVLQQLFRPGSLYVSPRLSLSSPYTVTDLGDSPRDALVQRETSLLLEHCREFGGSPV
ncbi:MAG: 1-acyl-sn-glycerol-3-phosphate acyltransferase [Chloroflexota bacterium]